MPKTKEYTIYTFDELSDDAKETARDWWRQCENEDFDTEFLYEDFQNMARMLGIEFDSKPVKLMGGGTRYDPVIYWSGFSSQGDGACFEGNYRYAPGAAKAIAKETNGSETELIRIAKALQEVQRRNFYRLNARMKHRGHYMHSGCMTVEHYGDNFASDTDAEDTVEQCMRDFADWMYKQLEKEYWWRMEDAQVDESIRANEYTFDEDGNRQD